MRRKLGASLAFVGVFMVALAILAQAYAAGQLMKTPLDVDTVTHLSGPAELAGPDGIESFDAKVTSTTKVDSAKSDDQVVVFKNSSCVVKNEGDIGDCVSSDDPQHRLIAASLDDFATDRVTGIAVNDPKYLPADAVPHEGLVNKWPFESEKKDYPYWNGMVGAAVPANYIGTDSVEGVDVYVYEVIVTDLPIEIADGVPGLYNDTTTIYVEPLTGAIINQTDQQTRTMPVGSPVLKLDVGFTPEQQKISADEAGTKATQLKLLTKTVPLVGYVLGIPMLLGGLVLLFLSRKESETEPGKTAKKAESAEV